MVRIQHEERHIAVTITVYKQNALQKLRVQLMNHVTRNKKSTMEAIGRVQVFTDLFLLILLLSISHLSKRTVRYAM